ncbi:hypothetical protein ORJ04_03105 [Rheinheimera baltica]|uniref:General secretion pathway protein M n=1 Tax=Rheinheimera baltica TaxID=67576 RepID=A0ABT9HUX8_9GAMM|nr:hypothetical protein [Rheinheimera baltica]MDP5134933.1 hypothetical protein [Rheinheimera baltica]MDP5149816.1 hypothetical protein [Rheinheimera baltica]
MSIDYRKTGIVLIVLLVLLKFAVVPWFNWVSLKTSNIHQVSQSVGRLEQVQLRTEALQQHGELINRAYTKLADLWLANGAAQPQVVILRHLENLAGDSGVELNPRNIGQPIEQPISSLPLSLFVNGHPQNVSQFLVSIEREQPAAIITGARLVKARPYDKKITAVLDVLFLLAPKEAE